MMSSETTTKLKTIFYNDTRKICRETGMYIDYEFETDAMDLISEMAWKKLLLFASDLEAFAKHAKRSTVINVEDVKLLVRRNESLKSMVEEKCRPAQSNKTNEETGGAKRKRKPSSSSNNN